VKKALSPGHVLAFCLPALVIGIAAEPAAAIIPLQSSEHSVSVRHLEGSQYRLSVSTSMVTEVQFIVDGVLATTDPDDPLVDELYASLEAVYGSRLTGSAVPMGYAIEWDGQQWVLVCTYSMTIEIDFGTRGTVVVEASDAVIG
jgi:hypothetical protein